MDIVIARDFTDTPGARYITDGEFSGESFRNELLEPKFKEALEKNEKLIIDFDGAYGYPPSFLEEAFGGLARIYGADKVLQIMVFKSQDQPNLEDKVKNYIMETKKLKGR